MNAGPLNTVGLIVVFVGGAYWFHALDGERAWSGCFQAPDRDAATAEAVRRVQRESPQLCRLRVLTRLDPTSTLGPETLPGVSIEEPATGDPLMKATATGLAADLLKGPSPDFPPIRVAVNASVRSQVSGYDWLADAGDFGLLGIQHRTEKVVAELSAVNDAIRRLPYERLTLVTDSPQLVDTMRRWIVGGDVLPDGRTAESAGLTDAQRRIRVCQYRMNVLTPPGRNSALLHEGADELARLAARCADHGDGMTSAQYREEATDIAEVVSHMFRAQSV